MERTHKEEFMKSLLLRLLPAFLICLGLGIFFGYTVTAISNKSIEHFDTTIIGFVQSIEAPWLTSVMKIFTMIGAWQGVAPITMIAFLLLFFKYKYKKQAFLLVIVIGGTVLFNALLKIYFKRDRPEFYRMLDAGGFSFPSGHTMSAFSLYVILAFIIWRNIKTPLGRFSLILFTTFMIAMICLSRIYLGVHYPSDIIGGIAASAFWLTIATTVYRFYQNPREKKSSHPTS